MRTWQDGLDPHGILAGQVLLAPLDFGHRTQYLHARGTLSHLVALGVVPVVNENDAVADEEIRFGDNDRLAALVAHLVHADLLLLLTDAPGLLTADPREFAEASLIEEVVEIDHQLEVMAGGPGSADGQRGHGLEAGRGEDGDLVGGRDGHRRRRPARRGPGRRGGRARRGHRLSPPPGPSAGPQIVDRLRPGGLGPPGGRCRGRAGPGRGRSLAAAGRRGLGRRARSFPTTRWRSPGPTARSLPRAWCAWRRTGHRSGPAAAPISCPRTCRTWSCTVTTWCLYADPVTFPGPRAAGAPRPGGLAGRGPLLGRGAQRRPVGGRRPAR